MPCMLAVHTAIRNDMNRLIFAFALLLSVTACAPMRTTTTASDPAEAKPLQDDSIALFSTNPIGVLPERWTPLVLFRTKKQTQYQLVSEQDKTVLHAYAPSASSGLMQYVSINPALKPWLNWQWKVGSLVQTTAVNQGASEDSPARIILGFDGDKDTLSFSDQILFETARVFTGYDFPYATLMYVWDSHARVGSILTSNRSSRIKMLVVANSAAGIGDWQVFTRNIVEDFQRAFGEAPGKLIGVGVLTDTDNQGETVEAWYGDIRLQRDQ